MIDDPVRLDIYSSNPYLPRTEVYPNTDKQQKASQGLPANKPDAKENAQNNGVVVEISEEARQRAEKMASAAQGETSQNSQELTREEKAIIDNLEKIDREVHAHERAHMAAGGNLVTRAANYEYQTGPDGKRYAVGGEVQIDTSPEKDPQATIRKAQRIRAAALAPAKPSAQDRRVAAQAASMAREAAAELAAEDSEAVSGMGETENSASAGVGQVNSSDSMHSSTNTNNYSSSSLMPASLIQQAYQGMSGAFQPSLTRLMYA